MVNGVRIYLCDTRLMADYTKPDSYETRNGQTKDALICLSGSAESPLDPDEYAFPIDRSGGFEWTGEQRGRVDDNRLTVRVHLKDEEPHASLSEISFHVRDRRPK